ncbi:hypothetical protein HDV00_003068 [Rhizophlyctis rosea]|nr:hypothetical protein HDV00_003068 [Rhizophlyctis rosea]
MRPDNSPTIFATKSPTLTPQHYAHDDDLHHRPPRPRRRQTAESSSSLTKSPSGRTRRHSVRSSSPIQHLLPPAAETPVSVATNAKGTTTSSASTRSRSVSSERLDAALQQTGIPSSPTTIDLRELGTEGPALCTAVFHLLHEMFPHTWTDVNSPDDLKVDRVSGAMTNCVFIVSLVPSLDKTEPKRVLLRVYGTGVEEFIEREHELVWMSRLSDMGVGPKLLGVFANGRFEEFLDSSPLTKESIRNPITSRKVAAELCRFHNLIRVAPAEELASAPDLFAKMRDWHAKAVKGFEKLRERRPEQAERLRGCRLEKFGEELGRLEECLRGLESPVVFAHNDSQYGNILKLNNKDGIVLVDYEYSAINYRGYDIGNHFCEWGADYHGPTPHLLDFTRYPSPEEQRNFLSAYIQTLHSLTPASSSSLLSPSPPSTDIDTLMREANSYALCSHVLWGFWGVMQAVKNEVIEFDYVGYAVCRLGRYWETRGEVLGL